MDGDWAWNQAVDAFRRSTRFWQRRALLGDYPNVAMLYDRVDYSDYHWRLYSGYPPVLLRSGKADLSRVRSLGEANMAKAIRSALAGVLAVRKVASAARGRVDPADAAQFPLLVEMLTLTTYPDGSVREPSRLSLTADRDGGGWRLMLKEDGQGLVLWSHAPTLAEALASVEAHLGQDEPDWRQDRYATKATGKKGR